ncbi:MAG: hypothetical protein NZ602_00030, partial [Thermoguttaceae bacterium]|nr:hypothetical protein [Thermoguttaceae bacterium]
PPAYPTLGRGVLFFPLPSALRLRLVLLSSLRKQGSRPRCMSMAIPYYPASSVLVVGGGVGGMRAAVDLAEAGLKAKPPSPAVGRGVKGQKAEGRGKKITPLPSVGEAGGAEGDAG